MRSERLKNELVGKAIAFAARAHDGQLRKDNKTPYMSHPFRVCMTVRNVFEMSDERVLAAAVLHDTIEDTRTDRDDLIEEFGPEIAGWVALLSKDKRLEDQYREKVYAEVLSTAPDAVKIVKLADIYDNLMDSSSLSAEHKEKTLKRLRYYLTTLKFNASHDVTRAITIVEAILMKPPRRTVWELAELGMSSLVKNYKVKPDPSAKLTTDEQKGGAQ